VARFSSGEAEESLLHFFLKKQQLLKETLRSRLKIVLIVITISLLD